MIAARWTIAALALAAASPAALPTPPALFQQAWQAGGGLPRLVAAREHQTIAGYDGQNQFPLLGAKTAIASPRLSQDVRWQIALQGIAAADQHAAVADDQFDISTPDAAAQAQARMGLPALIMTIVYKDIAAYEPALSLTHARACQCRLFQPLILARVAEGMTPAGALAHQ